MFKKLRVMSLSLALVFCVAAGKSLPKVYASDNTVKVKDVVIDLEENEDHIHSFGKWELVKEPTCTEAGEKRRYCTICDTYEGKPVAKLGHKYSTSTVKATYFNEGGTRHTCSRCGNTYMTDTTPALALAKAAMNGYSSDESSVTVKWKAVTGATGYRVYRYNSSLKKWEIIATLGNVLKYTDTGRVSNTKYAYTVKAYVKSGSNTKWGTTADCIWVMTAPGKAALTVTPGNYSATLKWASVTGTAGYKLYYKLSTDTDYKALAVTKNTSYTVTGLTKDKKYDFCIRTYNTYNSQNNLSSKVIASATVKGGLYDNKTISVTNILQNPQLPTGCEVTSLTILLNHYGYNVDKLTMARTYLPQQSFYWKNGTRYGADLNTAFAGNPESSYSYGCYSGCIELTANKYFAAVGASRRAHTNNGQELETLLQNYINYDKPVLIWITSDNLIPAYYTDTWYTPSGTLVRWLANEHCVVLTGYDNVNKLVYVADPLVGNTSYSLETLKLRYNQLGKQSVYFD